MIVGIPKEVKDQEGRVALPPEAVTQLVADGHRVQVQAGAGVDSGFADADYRGVGAEIVDVDAAFSADLVLKVKEPQPHEMARFHPEQMLFTYLHLAADRELTQGLMETGVTALAYEAVVDADGALPLLAPMSRVAGALAVVLGGELLQRRHGGRGVLLPGLPDIPGGRVTVLGAGVVGSSAAQVAAGMGARVTVLDRAQGALDRLSAVCPEVTTTPLADATAEAVLTEILSATDLLVGAVLVPDAQAPRVVSRAMVQRMPTGSVLVDVAIDQGGCVEGIRTTSHSQPAYAQDGVLHCAIPNLPGIVPLTSTRALAAATLPRIRALAARGWRAAAAADPGLAAAVRMTDGSLSHRGIAEAFQLPYNEPF